MPDQYQRPYLDSNVFIAWIQGEVVDGVDREGVASHLFAQAQRRLFSIFTSAWTIAEVHKPRGGTALSNAQDDRILAFFESDFIEIIDIDRNIGEEANRLCRRHGLTPSDAVHFAAALRAGCDVYLSWDEKFSKIAHPQIRTETPQLIGQGELPIDESA